MDNIDMAALEAPREVTDADRSRVAELARGQLAAIDRVRAATRELRDAIDDYQRIATRELPEALRDCGLSDTRLFDDARTRVRHERKYVGTKLVNPEGLAWVSANGGDSTIKTVITVEMDRGDADAARELFAQVRLSPHANRFKTCELAQYVHNSTIGSFAKECAEKGLNPPLDVLGVTVVDRAIVGDSAPRTIELKGFDDGKTRAHRRAADRPDDDRNPFDD